MVEMPSIPDLIRAHTQSQRPANPGFCEPHLPNDTAAFWQALETKGWGAAQEVDVDSAEGFTFLSFVLFHVPERMGEAVAIFQQHPQAPALINRPDPHGHHQGWTPLHWAARLFQGQPWVPTLLSLGADASLTCHDAQTVAEDAPQALGLLMLSFNARMQQFYQPDFDASVVAAQALMDAGSDLAHANDEGTLPIHGAAQFAGHLLPLLLSHPVGKTTVNAVDGFAQSPLTRALIFQPSTLNPLLEAGADPWLALPRADGVFRNAPDVARLLLGWKIQSPHARSREAMDSWQRFLEHAESVAGDPTAHPSRPNA